MLERRQNNRGRVYYGGRVAFNERQSTLDCVVRNISPEGALVYLFDAGEWPCQADLLIPSKGAAFPATLIWQRGRLCGLAIHYATHVRQPMLDVALRLRAVERANKTLHRDIEKLRGFC